VLLHADPSFKGSFSDRTFLLDEPL
jgi:hypothetical protein